MQRGRHKLLLIARPAPPLLLSLAFDPALRLHSCPPVVQYVFRRNVLKKLPGTHLLLRFLNSPLPMMLPSPWSACPPVVQYVFRRDVLKKLLGTQKARDFGRELIPEAIKEGYKVGEGGVCGCGGREQACMCVPYAVKEGYKVREEPGVGMGEGLCAQGNAVLRCCICTHHFVFLSRCFQLPP